MNSKTKRIAVGFVIVALLAMLAVPVFAEGEEPPVEPPVEEEAAPVEEEAAPVEEEAAPVEEEVVPVQESEVAPEEEEPAPEEELLEVGEEPVAEEPVVDTPVVEAQSGDLLESVSAFFAPMAAGGQAGTTLSATKTAAGFWEIEYDWTVEKSVDPTEVTVGIGESATVTYEIIVTRTRVSESIGVRGEVCVTNGGDRTTEGLQIVDQVEYKVGAGQFGPLAGASQTINPDQLGPGQTECYDYEIEFTPVAGATYRNTAKVTITNHSGHLGEPFGPEPKADFSLPATPTEIDELATLVDVETCPEGFTCVPDDDGPWYFTDSGLVTFNKKITNVSAECDEYFELPNTATLTEDDSGTERTDDALVEIYTGECVLEQWCSPGYWRQPQHLSSWAATGYSPSQYYNALFDPDVTPSKLAQKAGATANPTLWQVLQSPEWYGGEAFNKVGDLLSAAHPDVNFLGNRVEDSCPLN